jgi:replicative DNA helicase
MNEPISLPYSPANEESVLGSVLLNQECLKEIDLEPEEFYVERNRFIWQAIQVLRMTGQDIDVTTICTQLDRAGKLEESGGYPRISAIINNCPTSLHARSYAANIKQDALRRKTIDIAGNIAKVAFDRDKSLSDFIPGFIDQLSKMAMSGEGAIHWKKFVSDLYDEISKACENPLDVYGIPTGILDFDAITGGLIRGEEVKLSGEPGVGKSMLAMQMVCHAAGLGHPGVCYHLEMSGRAIARRVVSVMSKVPTRVMRTGKVSGDQWVDLTGAVDRASQLPIYMSDSSNWTTAALRVDIERMIGLYKIEWVLVDYEALLGDDPDKDDNMRSKIISSRLHGIIKDLNIAGLVIDDMNKVGISAAAGKGNTNQASLAGSARKLYDADSIWILRKNKEQPNMITLKSEKLREGEGDSSRIIQLLRLPGIPEFHNVEKKRVKEEPVVYGRDN